MLTHVEMKMIVCTTISQCDLIGVLLLDLVTRIDDSEIVNTF